MPHLRGSDPNVGSAIRRLCILCTAGLLAIAVPTEAAPPGATAAWEALSRSVNRSAVALAAGDRRALNQQADTIERALHQVAAAREKGSDRVPLEQWREAERLSHAFIAAVRSGRTSEAGELLRALRLQIRLIAPTTRPTEAR